MPASVSLLAGCGTSPGVTLICHHPKCGRSFAAKRISQKYCCKAHQTSVYRKKVRLRNNPQRKLQCRGCLEYFKTQSHNKLYCSKDCRAQVYLERKRFKGVPRNCRNELCMTAFVATQRNNWFCCRRCAVRQNNRLYARRKQAGESFEPRSAVCCWVKCGKVYTKARSNQQKFCSLRCKHNAAALRREDRRRGVEKDVKRAKLRREMV